MKYLARDELEIGDAYAVNARNFNVAIWTGSTFQGMRFKMVDWFLDQEDHFDDGGTVKPTERLTAQARVPAGQDLHTILAALRYYQQEGMGNPLAREGGIHDIATNSGCDISMDAEDIDDLCERLNQ